MAIRFVARQVALAAAMACGSAQANIQVSGDFWSSTGQVPSTGNNLLETTQLHVGRQGVGSLTVDGGSFLELARLNFGELQAANGSGLISGAGSTVEVVGPYNRVHIGGWGSGQLTINNGGLLNTRVNAADCLLPFRYCDSFVGTAAGGSGILNIDGAGSEARIGRWLFVAQPYIDVVNGVPTWGTPGGTSRGTVNVTNGALLSTDRALVAPHHWATHATGRERNIGEVNVSGAGSRWEVVGGQRVDDSNGNVFLGSADIVAADHRNAWATINVTAGGVIEFKGSSDAFNTLSLTTAAGRSEMLVSGAGSAVTFSTASGVVHVGRRLGMAQLDIRDGGGVQGAWYTAVGRDGSTGVLNLDGATSFYRADGTGTATAIGRAAENAVFDVANGGTGTVNVTNGATLSVTATAALANGPHLSVGRGLASSGTLNIGSGAKVMMTAQSVLPGGGAGEALNPWMRVGRDGAGALNVTGGAKLLMQGNAVSTVAHSRSTGLYIGGTGDTSNGGTGIALVSGAGSEIAMTGSDTVVIVGIGPQSNGQLTVNDQASVSATGMNVGRSGGVGVLKVNNATLNFSGQHTGSFQSGAFLSIGRSGGIGVAELSNGSVVTLSNAGTAGASLNLGGTGPGPLGDGSLTVSGGSQVRVQAAPGLGVVSVGRDGSALLRVKGASLVDVSGGQFFVARLAGSDGTAIVTENSVINAGWVGIGRNLVNGVDVDGGTATMVLNGATLNATDIVIGSNGFLGGSAGAIVASGTITNYGIFAPGSSPGTFTIDGDYVAGAGSRLILEVQGSADSGFATDLVYFKQGNALDLAALNVEFRFLGGTNPEEFKQSGGFDIDTFLAVQTASGQTVQIDHALLANTSYSARADAYTFTSFDFSADGGASFVAVPVPEPGAWALMLAGGGFLAGLARRRHRAGR